jgi:hypothetical protein
LKGKRLLGAFGNLWGSTLEPESLLDDLLYDLPYLEMFYTYSKYIGAYELKTSIKKEATQKVEDGKEVNQKNKIILLLPENPPSKDVLIPKPQIRGIKPKLSNLDQYLHDNPLPD